MNYFVSENAKLYQSNDLTKDGCELIVGLEEAGPDQIDQDLAESVINDLNTLYEPLQTRFLKTTLAFH